VKHFPPPLPEPLPSKRRPRPFRPIEWLIIVLVLVASVATTLTIALSHQY
jgi:hypothetical protein